MPDDKHKIEDIKNRLYDREDTVTNRHREVTLHPISHKVDTIWKTEAVPTEDNFTLENQMRKPRTSFFKKFFIGAIVFFICTLGFAGYMFYSGGASVSSDNIDILVLGNAFTKGGDELPLQIEIVNRNRAKLELANLIISYPRGASDNASDVIRLPRDPIGTIGVGQSITRNAKITLFGDEKSIRNVKISLEYHPEGSNAIFTKDILYPITISSAPLSLSIDAPNQTTSDQMISLKVTATLNTSLPEGRTILQVTYPNGFVFDSALPIPHIGNSVWNLDSLTPTNPVTIVINGRLIGQDGDEQVFHAYAGTTTSTDQSKVNVVYNSLLKSMTISKPFLEARVLVNNQDLSSYTASSGEIIHGEIAWTNNLSSRITDGQIIVNISGNAFDKMTVNPLEGFYDSANSQIVWDKNSVPEFASIEPGDSGTVSFNIKSLSLVGPYTVIKDPQIVLDVSVRGRQPSSGSTYNDVNNFAKKIIKILSDFQIASSANYTTGPLPPKAESETKYTVTWTLSNSANPITGAVARSVLPIYVKWAGLQAGENENVTYNEVTREVIWNIGAVNPNTGFNSNREASFVLTLKPSLSQVGSVPQLMKETLLSGIDAFAGVQVKSKRGPITTLLSNDPNFHSGNERVVQ